MLCARFCKYSGICLICHRLIHQFAQFVTFLSILALSLSFVYLSVCLIANHLLCQFAQFVTSFYPLEAFYSANKSFAVLLLMSKELVRVGMQTN